MRYLVTLIVTPAYKGPNTTKETEEGFLGTLEYYSAKGLGHELSHGHIIATLDQRTRLD